MDYLSIIASTIFVLGYAGMTLEHKLRTNKSAIALSLAGILWIITAFSHVHDEELTHSINEAGTEVFGILIFLLSAMTLVEILIHYRFFDMIRLYLLKFNLKDRGQFIIISILTFFLSAILDNLTVTIVMIQIARKFFKDKNMIIAAAGIVIMANAGGAWSPVGDVTTIMLWLAQKFSALEVIAQGIIPAIALALVSGYLLVYKMKNVNTRDDKEEVNLKFSKSEKLVITFTLFSFTLPLFMNLIGLAPYMGLIFGLGIVWMLIKNLQLRSKRVTHLDANIDNFFQKTDISSLQFFAGILLSVSALKVMGVLDVLSRALLGQQQEFMRVFFGSVILGLFSAVVDNVPLTAIAIDIIKLPDPSLWVLIALAVGTGGSCLVLGSVAGVVAMGMVKDLTFGNYLKIATVPAFAGYIACIATWYAQLQIMPYVQPRHIFISAAVIIFGAILYLLYRGQKPAFNPGYSGSARKRVGLLKRNPLKSSKN